MWKLWWILAGLLKFQADLMLQALKMENEPSQKTWTWNFNMYLVWRLHPSRLSLQVAEAVREHSICGKKYTAQAFFQNYHTNVFLFRWLTQESDYRWSLLKIRKNNHMLQLCFFFRCTSDCFYFALQKKRRATLCWNCFLFQAVGLPFVLNRIRKEKPVLSVSEISSTRINSQPIPAFQSVF